MSVVKTLGPLLVAVLSLAAGPALRQQPFRTGTNVVRVDATVVDRQGNPVTSLTAEDFEVREDGQPQAITSFKLVEANGQPTDDLSLDIRGPEHAKAEAARDDVRVFLIFWDEYHIEQFRAALFARQAFERIMLDAFGPTDLVAIMDPLTPTDAIRFSRDRRALTDQMHKLVGRRGIYIPMRSVVEEEHFRTARNTGEVEVIRGEVTRSAIKAAATFLGTLKEGRKNLIVVSESLGPVRFRDEQFEVMRDLTRAANDSNTAIYAVDPRGLTMSSNFGSMLHTIAAESGGETLQTNDIAKQFSRVVKQSTALYLLGYAREIANDGKFHEIKVKVRKPGLEVRARSGYWAPKLSDVMKAKEAAAAAVLPPDLADAFASLTPVNARSPIDLWAGVTADAQGRRRISVAWAPRAVTDRLPAIGSVALAATSKGASLFNGPVPAAGVSFAASADVQLVFTVHDASGEILDRISRTVALPPPADALVFTTPAVSRARTPIELKALASAAEPPLFAGRDFAPGDRLLIRFGLSGDAEGTVVSASLIGRQGARLTALTVNRDAPGAYRIDLPLNSIARGEYVVEIAAVLGGRHAASHLAFRVK
jgi:VWFA-related protein